MNMRGVRVKFPVGGVVARGNGVCQGDGVVVKWRGGHQEGRGVIGVEGWLLGGEVVEERVGT